MKTVNRQNSIDFKNYFVYVTLLLVVSVSLGLFCSAPLNAGSTLTESERSELRQEMEKEEQRARALKSKVPETQQLATQKFAMKARRILDSMYDYYIRSIGSRFGPGILRKDVDRYNDAIVEAKGEVPDEVIAYVEEVYAAFRKSVGSTNRDDLRISWNKRLALKILEQ